MFERTWGFESLYQHIVTSMRPLTCLAAFLMAVSAHASPTRGTVMARQVIQPGHVAMIPDVELEGKNVALVTVGATGGEVDCLILNEKGKVVAKDESRGNTCKISYVPKRTGRFTLLVTNIDPNGQAIARVVIQ